MPTIFVTRSWRKDVDPPSATGATGRCEACRGLADDPIHQRVYGAGFFGSLVDDPTSPWVGHWEGPHHRFVPPPPSTAVRVAEAVVAHDLDLPAPNPGAGPHSQDLSDLTGLSEPWLPPEPDTLPAPRPSGARRTPARLVVWLLLVSMLGWLAPFATAASQLEISEISERLADLERRRLELATEVDRLTEELGRLERAARRATYRSEELERLAADLRAERRELVVAAVEEALRPPGPPPNVADPTSRSLGVAYLDLGTEARGAVLEGHEVGGDALDAAREELDRRLREVAGRRRDALVRLAELDRRILRLGAELQVTRREAAARLGIDEATERWRPLVAKYFPAEHVDDALWVMWCESRGDPEARAWPRSTAVGLYQFLAGTWEWVDAQIDLGGASRTDPEANVKAAAWLWEFSRRTRHPNGPWGPWSCRP